MFVVFMTLFGLPYAMLVGVVIAVTALIPIMGAFIGCFIGAFLILIVSPVQALIFLVMFLVLQQIDGNIIAPRIHSSSTGLAPVWVIVSITLMSGLFGFIGMFIGVPCFSVLYTIVKQYVDSRLEKKSFSTDTLAYMNKDARKYYQKPEKAKRPIKEVLKIWVSRFPKKKKMKK
jgi:predicted PurR-regulated permease PerM